LAVTLGPSARGAKGVTMVVTSRPEENPPQSQNIPSLFKAAPSTWENHQERTPLRHRLSLHGVWRATCEEPELAGDVQIPGAFSFEGQVVFQRAFRLDSTFMNRPVRLVIHGAHYETKVEVNGELAGSQEGGYTPFAIDLNPERLFFDKENLLILTINNQLSPLQTLPAKQRPLGWLNEGGVLREIYLEALPNISIDYTRLAYDFDQLEAKINLEAEVRLQKKRGSETPANVNAVLEIWDADAIRKLTSSISSPLAMSDKLRQTLSLTCQLNKPALWSPGAPHLYAFRLVLVQQNIVIDEWWQKFGFRKIEISDRQFRLNGQPFILRGVNWIEDYGHGSMLLDTAYAVQMLAKVKELGANAIRVIGHPPHPFLPALCDRAGLFLLEELPLYYLTDSHFRQARFAELALLQAREMIRRDLNHPSILSWGVSANSAIITSEAKNTMSDICRELRLLDHRPIYAATPPGWVSAWEPLVDFLMPDLFQHEHAGEFFPKRVASGNKPLLPMIGFWVRPDLPLQELKKGNRGQHGDAEQWQAERLDNVLEKLEEMPQFSGYFIQALKDWPAPRPVLVLGPSAGRLPQNVKSNTMNGADHYLHPAGLIDSDGQPRLAFQVVQAFNRGDRRPVLIAKTIPPVHPQEYPIIGIGVLLILVFYLNRDRRLRGNMRRIFVHPHGFYVDINENRKVPPNLSALLGLAEGCIIAILLSGFCYANRESLIFDQCLNLLIDDPITKARAAWLIWHPGWFIAFITLGWFGAGTVAAVFLRILGFFLGRSLPTVQYFTFVFWTAASVLVLGIVAPFFYRLLLYPDFNAPIMFCVMSILIWTAGRYFRGMCVIYTMSILRTLIIFGIIVGGLIFSIALYYDRTQAIFQYAGYYWQLLNTGI
jgi:hypothetical protein